jgi:hypothetical protein
LTSVQAGRFAPLLNVFEILDLGRHDAGGHQVWDQTPGDSLDGPALYTDHSHRCHPEL